MSRTRAHLAENDAETHLRGAGAAILTGPTDTNVNDITVVVVVEYVVWRWTPRNAVRLVSVDWSL